MRIAIWVNALAVRLLTHLLWKLGFKAGDRIGPHGDAAGYAIRRRHPEAVLAGLERFRGRLLAVERLSRDEAHER